LLVKCCGEQQNQYADLPVRKLLKIATYPIRAAIVIGTLVELLLRPLYRPVVNAVRALGFFAKLERWIAGLPRLAILVLFAVPFAIAEPMKVAAVVIIAEGHIAIGATILTLSYLATFLIVERIYHAGRHKLLTYKWFTWAMTYVWKAHSYYGAVKVTALATAKTIQLWLTAEIR
jgi:hypothetical protein